MLAKWEPQCWQSTETLSKCRGQCRLSTVSSVHSDSGYSCSLCAFSTFNFITSWTFLKPACLALNPCVVSLSLMWTISYTWFIRHVIILSFEKLRGHIYGEGLHTQRSTHHLRTSVQICPQLLHSSWLDKHRRHTHQRCARPLRPNPTTTSTHLIRLERCKPFLMFYEVSWNQTVLLTLS